MHRFIFWYVSSSVKIRYGYTLLFSAWIFLLVVSKLQFHFWSASFWCQMFTQRVMNSWKTIQSCRTPHVTWCREADVYEYHFQGGWTLSLPICQCVSEVRGEFLCVLLWFWLALCGFLGAHAVYSPYASQIIVGGWLSRAFIKGSGEVERAEWIKAVLIPIRRALLV